MVALPVPPKRLHSKKPTTVPLSAAQMKALEEEQAEAKRAEEAKQAEPDPGEIHVSVDVKGWQRDFAITISSED